jgi:hypothetical protein
MLKFEENLPVKGTRVYSYAQATHQLEICHVVEEGTPFTPQWLWINHSETGTVVYIPSILHYLLVLMGTMAYTQQAPFNGFYIMVMWILQNGE